MLLTDLNGPMSLQPRRTGVRTNSRSRVFAGSAILIFAGATFGATISLAQEQQDQQDKSVAEAARLEKARKQEQAKKSRHVYTEEDLKHPNILTPEDRAQVEARRNECAQKNNCAPGSPQNPPASLDADSQQQPKSLGEIARELRKQKELEALKPKQSEPFHLPFSTPALASPILPERPAIRPPAPPVLRAPAQPNLHPKTPANVFRRDPFSSVPVPAVRKPEVPKPQTSKPEVAHSEIRPSVREDSRPDIRPDFTKEIHPAVPSRRRMIAPAAPKISARPATPGTLLELAKPSAPIRPAQPAAPVAPVSKIRPVHPPVFTQPAQPLVPSEIIRPAQPVAPPATVRPVEPKRTVEVPPPAPVATVQGTVTVRTGDSLWKLAQHALGHGSRWPELLALNPGIANPNQIHAGATLNLPAAAASAAYSRDAQDAPAATITVRSGDTLWSLAKANRGRASYWPCLASANPAVTNPDQIFAGQSLVVPSSCAAVAARIR